MRLPHVRRRDLDKKDGQKSDEPTRPPRGSSTNPVMEGIGNAKTVRNATRPHSKHRGS